MNVNELKIRFKVVIPPDWDNRQKGKFWEKFQHLYSVVTDGK